MATKILTVEDDTAPPVVITLKRKPDDEIIDLTNVDSVDLIIRGPDGAITNTGHQATNISSPPTSGVIVYTREAGDIDTEGSYQAEARINYSDGTEETVYEKLTVQARARLD